MGNPQQHIGAPVAHELAQHRQSGRQVDDDFMDPSSDGLTEVVAKRWRSAQKGREEEARINTDRKNVAMGAAIPQPGKQPVKHYFEIIA